MGIMQERLVIRSTVTITLYHKGTGEIAKQGRHENMVVDDGLEMLARFLNATYTGISYIALGNDNTAAGTAQADLVAEQSRAAVIQHSSAGTGAANVAAFITAVNSTFNILEVGAFGHDASAAADSGVMYARTVVSGYDNSSGDYDVNIDWSFTITRD